MTPRVCQCECGSIRNTCLSLMLQSLAPCLCLLSLECLFPLSFSLWLLPSQIPSVYFSIQTQYVDDSARRRFPGLYLLPVVFFLPLSYVCYILLVCVSVLSVVFSLLLSFPCNVLLGRFCSHLCSQSLLVSSVNLASLSSALWSSPFPTGIHPFVHPLKACLYFRVIS